MTREQAITKIVAALVKAGMQAEQKNAREVIVKLCNPSDNHVIVTVGMVK